MSLLLILNSIKPKKKGKVEYFEPVFEVLKISDASNEAAIEIDKGLQEYLSAYLLKNKSTVTMPETTETKATEQPKREEAKKDAEDLPWEKGQSSGIVTSDDSEEVPF